MARSFVVGSRASRLALVQTNLVIDALRAHHPDAAFEVRHISTHGDRVLDRALPAIGGKGVFVREIEEALLAGKIDLAVHSLKDLPTLRPEGLVIAAVPPRADPRDVLVSRDGAGLAQLRPGARVGTSSPRRCAQLRALRPDLQPIDVRGSVDTRLHKLDEGQYDALVLAAAGLIRLGLNDRSVEFFDPQVFLPAPGQGALALEARAGDSEILDLLAALEHAPTRIAVTAERAFLRGLGGGCCVPIAAYATVAGQVVCLRAMRAEAGGSSLMHAERCHFIEGKAPIDGAAALGYRLAEYVLGYESTLPAAGSSS